MKKDGYSLFFGATVDALQIVRAAEAQVHIHTLCQPETEAEREIAKSWLSGVEARLRTSLATYLREEPK